MRSSTSLAVLIAFLQASLGQSALIAIKGSSLHERSFPGANGALSLASSGSIMHERRGQPERSSIVGGGGNVRAGGGGSSNS